MGNSRREELDEALQEIERLRWELNVVKSRYTSERRKCRRFQKQLNDLMKQLQSQKKTAAELHHSCQQSCDECEDVVFEVEESEGKRNKCTQTKA